MARLKIISKGVTERIWLYSAFIEKYSVQKFNITTGLIEDVATGSMDRFNTSNLWYADILFSEDCWYLVSTESKDDFLIYKVGSPAKELMFVYSKSSTLKVEVYDSASNFLSEISGTKISTTLFVLDMSLLGTGEFLIYTKGDFIKIKLPFNKEVANYNPVNKKIILKPGFNMVAWQGTGYGKYDDKTSSDISTVDNYIASQLNSKYGSNSWRGCRTYDEVNGRFLDYINGLTPSTAEGNFQLIIVMNGNRQVEGFELYSLVPYDMELECG